MLPLSAIHEIELNTSHTPNRSRHSLTPGLACLFFFYTDIESPSRRPAGTMRLTAELIQTSLSYLNPLKERELDLRGASDKLKRADTTLCRDELH